MSYKFIFEDNIDTPSSALLLKSNSNIYFSGGNRRLQLKLQQIYNNTDVFIIFCDVPPNNSHTIQEYHNLVDVIKENNMKNVYVIPIICIEHIIIKFLNKHNYLGKQNRICQSILDNLINTLNWDNLLPQIKYNENNEEVSLEKIFKRFMSEQPLLCQHNKNSKRIVLEGKFYREDCLCARKYCAINSTSNASKKSLQLYAELPIFSLNAQQQVNMAQLNITISKININKVLQKQKKYYEALKASMT